MTDTSCQMCQNRPAVVVVADQASELPVCADCWRRLEHHLPTLQVVSLAPRARR